MQTSVRDYFIFFSVQFENRVPSMYLDIKGLCTTGVGNLIDPIEAALGLPWLHNGTGAMWEPYGSPADQLAIETEWHRVKAAVDHAHGPTKYWTDTARLMLSSSAIDALVLSKLDLFERQLKARPPFAAFDSWPADAQLGLLSMSWACGPAFNFPHFEAACKARDFATAAAECHMADSNNPGLVPRNRANFRLFLNAAQVEKAQSDPAILHYPSVL